MQESFHEKILILLSYVMIIIIAIVINVFFIDKKSVDNYNNEFSQSKNQEDKLKNRTILFQQPNENSPAKHILIHLPEKEIFISTLHPAASLYEDVTDYNKVKECFDNLKKILKEKNIEPSNL